MLLYLPEITFGNILDITLHLFKYFSCTKYKNMMATQNLCRALGFMVTNDEHLLNYSRDILQGKRSQMYLQIQNNFFLGYNNYKHGNNLMF